MTPERIGPRQIIAVSSLSVSRFELTISIAERDIAGTISGFGCWPGGVDGSDSSPSGVVSPNSRGIDGPVMSASRMPTFLCARRRPTASSAVVSDLPTPPLPDMIGTTYVKRARRVNSPGARRRGVVLVHHRRHAARQARLHERGDDRLDAQPVRLGALLDRLVLVDAAARAVQAELGQHLLGDREVGDELADVGCRG